MGVPVPDVRIVRLENRSGPHRWIEPAVLENLLNENRYVCHANMFVSAILKYTGLMA